MGPFRTLYLDMNSFFASVEQQLDPLLRGRPLAITAMEKPVGICVAASYEAKAFGVRTGTPVQEARRLCPGLAFRPSRHRLYVRFNLKIADVLDRHAELERIRSVDEFQLVLSGDATSLEGVTRLVSVLKAAVAREVGPCLRFSAGIGPNHLLAKIAGKLEKPDGFQWLSPENMPDRLAHLALDDLPGISRAMKARLEGAGIRDVPTLCRLDPRHARAIWRSVEGERFVRALQGEPIPLMRTKRGGFGNSKVLAPEFRDPRAAYLVSRWLVEKAAARLRRDGRVAAVFSLYIARMGAHSLRRDMTCAASQDSALFLQINRQIWRDLWPHLRGHRLAAIGVHLSRVELLAHRNGDLLLGLPAAEQTSGEKVAAAVDFINGRYGSGAITWGVSLPHPGFFERG